MDSQPIQEQPSLADPTPPDQLPEDRILWGCLVAFLAGVVLLCVALMGLAWGGAQLPDLGLALKLPAYLGAAGLYGALLIIPFGLLAIFLRSARLALWRGLALALAVAGLHGLILGLLLAADHTARYPTLPHWLPYVVSIAFSLVVIALTRPRFLAAPDPKLIFFAAGLGLLASAAWLWVGTLGNVIEIGLSLLDALSTALIGTVLLRLVTFYDDEFPARQPLWSALLSGGAFIAFLFGLMAVRGYALQGSTLSLALILAGFTAGALMTFGDAPQPSRTWWVVFAFLFFLLLIPFTWTEGFEGDYMTEDLGPAWAPALGVTLLILLLLGIVLLSARRWLARSAGRPALALSVPALAVIVGAAVYLAAGRPGIQAETFFVVMKDQADTSSALGIKDLAQRKVAVYQTLTSQAEKSQSGLRALLDSRHVIYHPYYLVNAVEVDGDPLLRAQIAARPDVDHILDSPHARSLPAFTTGFKLPGASIALSGVQWNVQEIHADQVWSRYQATGQGIVVGSADTGVDMTHPAIRSQYAGNPADNNYTWYDPWYGHTAPDDLMGHGTHTVGIMAGQDGIGVAPGAKWIACRNLGRNLGNPAVYLSCMQFLFAPFPMSGDSFKDGDPSRGADVVNNSWGCPPPEGCDANTLSMAVTHLYHAGQMYVVSAGNDGPDCSTIGVPANAQYALAVGAFEQGGTVTYFSSRGPSLDDGSGRIKPDVTAPGQAILSSLPGGGYGSLDGTSMAGPHVAGVVALLWSADPALKGDIDHTIQVIEQSAHYQTAANLCGASTGYDNNVYGYGDVDALAAVQAALGK